MNNVQVNNARPNLGKVFSSLEAAQKQLNDLLTKLNKLRQATIDIYSECEWAKTLLEDAGGAPCRSEPEVCHE